MSIHSALIEARHITITASLVRECGGMNEAAIASLIAWKTEPGAPFAVEDKEGELWWEASAEMLADWTGLSPDQARRSIKKLLDAGHIERRKLQIGGSSDHTYSYRLVRQIELAESPDHDVAESPNLPSLNKSNTNTRGQSDFEEIWAAWPKKDSKKTALRKWLALSAQKRAKILPLVIAHGKAHRLHTEHKYVPMLSTWLNAERWEDPLPGGRPESSPAAIQEVDPNGPPVYRNGGIVIPRGYRAVRDDVTGYFTHYEAIPEPEKVARPSSLKLPKPSDPPVGEVPF